MPDQTPPDIIVAEHYLERLRANGIRFLFANGGTDFAPLVHAYARNEDDSRFPTPILVPHESVAVAMAHGHYLVTGEPQAVMVHVNVGTANALCALINASRDNVPLLMTAGRSPLTESGLPASRDGLAQWAQEMFDQAGMLREVVKWDYELRLPDEVPGNVDRAVQVMRDLPAGPVYLSLPREVLAATAGGEPAAPPPSRPAGSRSRPARDRGRLQRPRRGPAAAAHHPLPRRRCRGRPRHRPAGPGTGHPGRGVPAPGQRPAQRRPDAAGL